MTRVTNGTTFKLGHMIISKLKKQSATKTNIPDISQMLRHSQMSIQTKQTEEN
jgi:hypothetical protein